MAIQDKILHQNLLKMNRILFSFLLAFFSFSMLRAQDNEILLTIGDRKITKGEFERIYRKNNSNLYNKEDKKTPEAYLDLFINFKLKVIEAERLKMDTSKAFIDELNGYRKELAAPYLTNVKFNEDMVRELYERTTKEVHASHILLRVAENATPEQEKEVLDRILKIRQEIIDGKDFAEAAVEYSEDPSVKNNKGDLNYFSALQMVTPFENAAYNTPVGEVSQPVRTSFGYHLLKVHDIRDNRGEIKVAHIMKMFPQDVTPEIKAKLKNEIDSIYAEIQKGADFAELARTLSDDKRSAVQNGEMPWFSEGRMIPEFAKPAFALKDTGDISEPIETPYGYHIIKKLDTRPVPSFEESKERIVDAIKRDPERSITSKNAFINELKQQYHYSENEAGKNLLLNKKIEDSLNVALNTELFNIDNKSYTIEDFRNYLKRQKIASGQYLSYFGNWIVDAITELEDSKLEQKYPDFRYLIQEYHDGILLFNISEEKIWNYAAEDSAGLEKFYSNLKKKPMWKERFKGMVITCKTPEVREEVENYLAENITPQEISDLLNKEENVFSFTEGAWEKGANAIVDYYVWNQPAPENFDSRLTFVRGDKIPPEPKKLEEARGLYISDYQKYLEEKWIKELRKKYKITVNKKLLKTIESV